MNYEFHLQDPTSASTRYLFEAIVASVDTATSWRGIFAFASVNGVSNLLSDPAVSQSLRRHHKLSLLVGLDAVTTRPTLEKLQECERTYGEDLDVSVFWNKSDGLFHPKICHFKHSDGSQTVVVGSGNLTPGGLRDNIEAYSIVRATAREALDLSEWDAFLRVHKDDIRKIDNEALERAARNIMRGGARGGGRRRRAAEPELVEAAAEQVIEQQGERAGVEGDRVLVAQIPKAGGRWNQVHFNRDIIQDFFRVQANSPERVYLTEKRLDGTSGAQEVRPCVYSNTNKNFKIEVAAKHGEAYPDEGVPIAVFRELQLRTFEYTLLMPDDAGYDAMLELSEELESIGKGHRRVVTDLGTVVDRWDDCPLA